MARPKAKRKKTAAPPPASELERATIINMKGSPDYSEWLEGVHRRTHIPKVQIFRLALAEWAEKHGHPTPPEI
ncbi:MAG TPA: hypothetical protein VHA57_03475 [Actinomycetota bacterium]|nr:hypothetical protein [Actinomycetota bacterium]